MSNLQPHERPTPIKQALAGSMTAGIRAAVRKGLTLTDINGNIRHWLLTYRNEHGDYPTGAEFAAAFEAEQLKHISEISMNPSEAIDDE